MFIIVSISLSLLFINLAALDPAVPPGDNFDLSHWKLTLPDASEKSASELKDGFENQYFKTADDGSLLFYVEGGSGSTQNSQYSRSELRHLCHPTASNPDRYNWPVSDGTYTVSGEYKIGDIDSSSRKIVIQQIHAYDGPPLVKIKWENGNVYALVKTNANGDDEDSLLLGEALQNTKFYVKTTVKDGYLKLYLNNVEKYDIHVSTYWYMYKNYFKTGNYLQSTSSSAYAYVYIYYLTLFVAGDCFYTENSDTLTNGDNDTSGTNKNIFIAIGCIALIYLILCCVAGYFVYRKKRANRNKTAELDLENEKDMNKDDKPMINNDEDNVNETNLGYDMENIEMEVEMEETVH